MASTGVPASMMPHTITLVRPVTVTDPYGSQIPDYDNGTRIVIRGWLQQDVRTIPDGTDGRTIQVQRWLLVTDHADVQGLDRFEWASPTGPMVFEADGPPEPAYTPSGFHHTEATLKVVTG